MLPQLLAGFYERDLRRLMDELTFFNSEADLWKVAGTVSNPAGNLALHIIGGMNHHIGANIGHTGFIRDRDAEFARKNVPRTELLEQLEGLIRTINRTLTDMSKDDFEARYPVPFDGKEVANSYLLIQLLAHLNYHLGQVNYLRRLLPPSHSPLP